MTLRQATVLSGVNIVRSSFVKNTVPYWCFHLFCTRPAGLCNNVTSRDAAPRMTNDMTHRPFMLKDSQPCPIGSRTQEDWKLDKAKNPRQVDYLRIQSLE